MDIEYIDCHTHKKQQAANTLAVVNSFPEAPIVPNSHRQIFSVGIHPWYIKAETLKERLEQLSIRLREKHVIAVGETGLDKVCKTPFDLQVEAFRAQIKSAEQLKLPLIIHCVRSWSELMSEYKRSNSTVPWVIHAYGAKKYITQKLLEESNFYFSFGGAIIENVNVSREISATIPIEHLMLETDNASIDIQKLYSAVAKIKGIHLDTLKKQIKSNFKTIFGLKTDEQ